MYYSPFNQFQNYSIRQESITRVTGEEGAKAYQMAPNSSAALFDGNEDIFYLKTTDGAGKERTRTGIGACRSLNFDEL